MMTGSEPRWRTSALEEGQVVTTPIRCSGSCLKGKARRRRIRLWDTILALDHIAEGAAPAVPDDLWMAVDIHISLWFMGTLSDDLYRLVSSSDGRAFSTWSKLLRFFVNNEASRYLFLNKAFRSTPRDDLDISTYASKLQRIADDLAAIGRPVDDRDLTL